MNPNEIPEAGWTYLVLVRGLEWLEPMVYAVGLVVALWAFRRCRKWGYLVLTFYFTLVLFSVLALPAINSAVRAQRAPDISEQTQVKIDAAVHEAIERVMEEEGHPILPAKRTVQVDFGPIFLVAGLWLVARGEPPAERSNQASERKRHAVGSEHEPVYRDIN